MDTTYLYKIVDNRIHRFTVYKVLQNGYVFITKEGNLETISKQEPDWFTSYMGARLTCIDALKKQKERLIQEVVILDDRIYEMMKRDRPSLVGPSKPKHTKVNSSA